MAQLTGRAILMGSCLGTVLPLANLYIGLKAGWGSGVAITASILSYAIWTSLLKFVWPGGLKTRTEAENTTAPTERNVADLTGPPLLPPSGGTERIARVGSKRSRAAH